MCSFNVYYDICRYIVGVHGRNNMKGLMGPPGPPGLPGKPGRIGAKGELLRKTKD